MGKPLNSLEDCEVYHDASIYATANMSLPSYYPVYGMNLSCASLRVLRALGCVPLNIDPAVNPHLDECEGINVSSFYFAGDQSSTPVHLEDGFLDSCNLIRWGFPGACKLWLFIHPRDSGRFRLALRAALASLRLAGDDTSAWGDDCAAPHHHKNICVTISFFIRNNIQYQIVKQEPGDLVYVGPGICHQVVNVGATLAEAVNVGGSFWNMMAHVFTTCGCGGGEGCRSHLKEIAPNPYVRITVVQRTIALYECPVEGCAFMCRSEPHFHTHMQGHAPTGSGSSRRPTCSTCLATFVNQGNLNKHALRAHSATKLVVEKVNCPCCGKSMRKDSLSRHQRGRCPKRPRLA